jgi:SAM-dependent MidA family methyltransferase
LVEAGAQEGRLAADILGWLQHDWPTVFGRSEYFILEPSARRRSWQQSTLSGFASKVQWLAAWEHVPAEGFVGVVFSNELLDAFPRASDRHQTTPEGFAS